MVVSLVAGTVLKKEIEQVIKEDGLSLNREQTNGYEQGAESSSNPTKEGEREEKRIQSVL